MSNQNEELPTIREFDGHDWHSTKFYRRNLPHWELKGSSYFITARVDEEVGKPFQDSNLAQKMVAVLYSEDKKKYLLHAFVIMPDHVHILIKPLANYTMAQIMKGLKGSSAYNFNKMLKRTGRFWQTENFDHLIRDGLGLREKWEYIKANPVKAKLVKNAEDYPYSSFYNPSKM